MAILNGDSTNNVLAGRVVQAAIGFSDVLTKSEGVSPFRQTCRPVFPE